MIAVLSALFILIALNIALLRYSSKEIEQ